MWRERNANPLVRLGRLMRRPNEVWGLKKKNP